MCLSVQNGKKLESGEGAAEVASAPASSRRGPAVAVGCLKTDKQLLREAELQVLFGKPNLVESPAVSELTTPAT